LKATLSAMEAEGIVRAMTLLPKRNRLFRV